MRKESGSQDPPPTLSANKEGTGVMEEEKTGGNRKGQAKPREAKAEIETAERKEPAAESSPRAEAGRPPREELTPPQLRAIKALLTLPTTVAAAEEIGVHPRTISRWSKEPAFRAEYLGQMSELQIELWRQMLGVRSEAWNRFLELMRSTNEQVALRATTWFLDRVLSIPAIVSQIALEDDGVEPDASPRLRALLDEAVASGARR